MEFHRALSLFFIFFSCFVYSSQAFKFYVGGKEGWVESPHQSYNQWAEKNRFKVNDTLYFKYKKGEDSVLLVKKDDYFNCSTKQPLKKMEDGESDFMLDRPGPFYFISGVPDHCQKGQKLIVTVLHPKTPPQFPPSPSSHSPVAPSYSPKVSPAPGLSPKPHFPVPSGSPQVSPSQSPAASSPKASSPAPSKLPPAPATSPVATSPSPYSGNSPAVTPSLSPKAGGPVLAPGPSTSTISPSAPGPSTSTISPAAPGPSTSGISPSSTGTPPSGSTGSPSGTPTGGPAPSGTPADITSPAPASTKSKANAVVVTPWSLISVGVSVVVSIVVLG